MPKIYQEACQLFIEQEIDKGLAEGKSAYSVGKDIAQWVEKMFGRAVKPQTIQKAMLRKEERDNVTSDSTPENQKEIEEKPDKPIRDGKGLFKEGTTPGPGRPPKFSVKPEGGDWYQSSESPEWETPQWLFDLLDKEFHFEIDVCASSKNHKCKKFFSKKEDGLKQDWPERCWLNPPYGREISDWMKKARIESEGGCTVVCLVPARPDTEWWWENCIRGEIRFIRGRLQWPGSSTAAPFPSAVIVMGPKIKGKVVWWDVKKFKRV